MTNPNQDATDQNTSTPWLAGDQTTIDMQPAGVAGYGERCADIQANLAAEQGSLGPLAELPGGAWTGAVIPEAIYTAGVLRANSHEFGQYFMNLGMALSNIGSAAKTVADSFTSADQWGAATLDAVRFAYGEDGAPRPPGLPAHIGKTWLDTVREAEDAAAAAGGETTGGVAPSGPTGPAPRVEETTSHLPDGTHETREATYDGGDGHLIEDRVETTQRDGTTREIVTDHDGEDGPTVTRDVSVGPATPGPTDVTVDVPIPHRDESDLVVPPM